MRVLTSAQLWKLIAGVTSALVLLLLLALQGGIANAGKSGASLIPRAAGISALGPQSQNGTGPLLPPHFVSVPFLAQPALVTAEEKQRLQKFQKSGQLHLRPVTAGTTAVHRADSSPPLNFVSAIRSLGSSALPQTGPASSPASFDLFRNTTLNAAVTNSDASLVLSPSATNRGPVVFETGNWFAALSKDGGQTWAFHDPFTAFGDPTHNYGGFSGNQIVTYDPRRDLTFWLLEYADNGTQNLLRLAVSRGGDIANGVWYYYDFVSDPNTRYDFPDLCTSNNELFITAMRGPILGGAQADTALLFRGSLDTLSNQAALATNNYSAQTTSPFRCTRGATDTMYWASHNSTSQIRIYKWPDTAADVSGITWNDVDLSVTWKDDPRNCGSAWCTRVDGRILGAWVAKGLVGFMWSASQDPANGYPFPYLEAMRANELDLTYFDRPFISDLYGALVFPSVAPNGRGDLGIAFFYGSSTPPSFFVGVRDDYSGSNWDLHVAQAGQTAPLNAWGDWTTVRPFQPTGLGWLASGYALPSGCNSDGCAVPSLVLFGRHRDEASVTHYWLTLP